jgi:hypothetical protein
MPQLQICRMRPVRVVPLVLAIVGACARADKPAPDSVAQSGVASEDTRWVEELGPIFAIPGDTDHTAIVLFPSSPAEQASVALLRTAGDSTTAARIRITPDSGVCDAATASFSTAGPSGWTVAFTPSVTAIRLDSIESLSPADSAALTTDVNRLASAVPNARESRFTGLPFGVLAAHRFSLDGSTVVIARVARRIPQEATPLEERTFMIGERSASSPFALKYSLRSSGAEDVVEHFALLAVVRAADKPFVVIESERESGPRYEIVERAPTGTWQLRWSKTLGC